MDHIQNQNKTAHPKEKANIFSLLTFFYTLDLFKKGSKKPLEESDLYDVLSKFKSKKLGDRMEKGWEKQVKEAKELSVVRLCWREFGWKYISLGVVQVIVDTILITLNPLAFGKLISYFTPNQTQLTKQDAYFYASIVIGISFFKCFYNQQYYLFLQEIGIQIRISLISLIYRKALRLSPSRLEDISIGKIVTLITKDVASFDLFLEYANEVWIGLLNTAVLCYLIFNRIGISTFAPVGFFIVIIPFQMYLGSLSSKIRMKMCKNTDERLKFTQETFSAIRIIKLYTWESFFEREIADARKKEMKKLLQNFLIRSFVSITGYLNAKVGFYILIMTYTWLGNYMTVEIVYYLTSSFTMLAYTMSILLPLGITHTAELLASIERLGSVLKDMGIETEEQDSSPSIKPKVVLINVTVEYKGQHIIRDIDLNLDMGFNLLTGAVGSGKSFLLKTILQDYEIKKGKVSTSGRISYASQVPWLFPSTIKQNILFGELFDEKRYADVIRVCALLYDFQLISDGDNTIVEDRGANLSQGQQARINLARAVYRDADIYLLDDCLAPLDAHVSDYIFNECFKKYLSNKLIILVTHNVHHVQNADRVILMSQGAVKSVVKPWELSSEELEEIEEVDKHDKDSENKENLSDEGSEDQADESEKLITETTTEKKVYKETKKSGKVDWNVYKRYFIFCGGFFVLAFVTLLLCGNQFLHSYTDKLISRWVDVEQKLADMLLNNITHLVPNSNVSLNDTQEFVTSLPQGLLNINSTSTVFAKNSSPAPTNLPINSNYINRELATVLPQEFPKNNPTRIMRSLKHNLTMKSYTYEEYENTLNQRNKMLLIYSILIITSSIGSSISTVALLGVAKTASIRIHKSMIKHILHATMYFFETNFVGNILNRFSKDLLTVDEQLAFGFQYITRMFLEIVGMIFLIASVNGIFLIPVVLFFVGLVLVRRFYLMSGRDLKRLDAMTRNPIVGHISATLEGITTVRAFKTQQILRDEFDKFQDLHVSANYCFVTVLSAFTLVLDVLCAIFFSLIIIKFLVMEDETPAGDVGLAISQGLTLSRTLQWGIRKWAELENYMISVERALEYTEVKQETTSGQILKHWPVQGEIIYNKVYLSYNNTDEYVLKNLNFVIKSREKIGVVGRTGAGKSSILSTLFRLYEVEGKILIDNVEIKTLTLDFLRKSISIIPQEPVLFIGTIRENIDPLRIYSDDQIWQAIETAHLKGSIPSLDFRISERGANFSIGQRQLICLARALLRSNKIIVLDEATANMDPETDDLIYDTIRTNFKDCTVITIAHNIKTILDSDKIMVLEKGEIMEFDDPQTLLRNTEGHFYKMTEKARLISKS